MTSLVTRPATLADLPALLPVIREFYAHFDFAWDEARKRDLLVRYLANPATGTLWLAERDGRILGYALVPFYFALEFDGFVALLDEFFLRPETRGQGLGAQLLTALATALKAQGLTRLRLEIDARHPEATALYQRLGFIADNRTTWSLSLNS